MTMLIIKFNHQTPALAGFSGHLLLNRQDLLAH